MRKPLRLLALLSLALVLQAASGVAQESPSVETLGPSDGAAGGEVVELVAPPPVCGTQPITIAKMQWPSAQILAEIHARILVTGFNCETQVVPGDMAATGSSMGSIGQPAVAPEMWITRVAEIWNQAIKAQKVRQAGVTYAEPVLEGWFIPDYVAAARPELTSAASLQQFAQVFATGGGSKGRLISCPIDWGCAVLNRNLLAANGLTALFDVVEPANRFELDTLIAEAVSRQEPILFYYWQPNAVLAQFAFKELDLGPFDQEAFACLGQRLCQSPRPSGFAPEPVVIALSEWVYLEAPEIAAYFQRARLPVAEMNALLQALNEPGATIESVADGFVANRGEVWRPWLGAPIVASPQ